VEISTHETVLSSPLCRRVRRFPHRRGRGLDVGRRLAEATSLAREGSMTHCLSFFLAFCFLSSEALSTNNSSIAVFSTSRSMIAIVRLGTGAHVRSTIQAESSPQDRKGFGRIAAHRDNR
jgi:hypothetical protein